MQGRQPVSFGAVLIGFSWTDLLHRVELLLNVNPRAS